MRITILCPAPSGSRTGNRVTAERWRRILLELGHAVRITHDAAPPACDLLIAIHATRSAAAVKRFRARAPRAPLVVALAGTDLYLDMPRNDRTRRSLELATRIVVLHPLAPQALPPRLRARTRVIVQSARASSSIRRGQRRAFDVAVVANLRALKDPFRAEEAARDLPVSSRLRVLHVGGELEAGFAADARRRSAANPRYRWLGARTPSQTRRLIARSRLLVLSSRLEGGANVISEAVVAGVPVLATRIPCTQGLLGEGYPGLFAVGSTSELKTLLQRAENDPRFRRGLERRCLSRQPLFAPASERRAWKKLLGEIAPASSRVALTGLDPLPTAG